MAEAHKRYWDVGTTLHLSEDEAKALFDVVGRVGGSSDNSRRRYIDAIWRAFPKMDGETFNSMAFGPSDIEGQIYFKDKPQVWQRDYARNVQTATVFAATEQEAKAKLATDDFTSVFSGIRRQGGDWERVS